MPRHSDQILTVAQMRAAEDRLIAAGTSIDALMQAAGRGAADYVWRVAAHHKITVLCGPGNNGGDGYVIAEAVRQRGGKVAVLAATEPKTEAARNSRALYGGEILAPDTEPHGEVLVDCLFGSGLTRPLSEEHLSLLRRLVATHHHAIAIDLPSGVDSDSGALLSPDLPHFHLTVALGAWKFAHVLRPASGMLGELRLVDIGCAAVPGAAIKLRRPHLTPPAADSHKYRRGLLAVVGGAMPGAAVLACTAAQGAGAGYVKLFADSAAASAPDLVVDMGKLSSVLTDDRNAAILVGPGLGRHAAARERLAIALADPVPAVVDADALLLLGRPLLAERRAPLIATPHEGEFKVLEKVFGCNGKGAKPARALTLARASGMIVVAKGPDTVIAAPDGRIACGSKVSSWLSVAGTGDVLAGAIASRLATGAEPFVAACEGIWLQGEAARLAGTAFTASGLAGHISKAYETCL
jgi:hydroxyethylthiazole kinase-like uncharacterized protein yjeF